MKAHTSLLSAATSLGITVEDLTPTWSSQALRLSKGNREILVLEGIQFQGMDHVHYEVARNKYVLKAILKEMGIPTPKGIPIDLGVEEGDEEDEAVIRAYQSFAQEDGRYVCKPSQAGGAAAVNLNVRDVEGLLLHLDANGSKHRLWMLEDFAEGRDLSLLVLKGRIVAAVVRNPLQVIGDGQHSLEELIDLYNEKTGPEGAVQIDGETRQLLRDQGAYLGEIVEAGRPIRLKNSAVGGTGIEDVTTKLHPRYAEWAKQLFDYFGAPLMGIDLLSRNYSGAPEENAVVLGINPAPRWVEFVKESEVDGLAGTILTAMME